MEMGLLWFDDGENSSLQEKISNAVSHYERRFGDQPTVCYMHPDTVFEDSELCNGVSIKTAPNVLPNHFWVGMAVEQINDHISSTF